MSLTIKFLMTLSLLTSLSFAQSRKEEKKLKRALRKAKCPKLEGSFGSCTLKSMTVDVSDEVNEFYTEIENEMSESWDTEISEEEKKEVSVTKNQFIYGAALELSGYFEYKQIEDEKEQIELVKTLTKKKVITMLNEFGSKITKEELKPEIEEAVEAGEFDISWETKLVDGKINFITEEGIFVVGQSLDLDGDKVKATCTNRKLKLSDGKKSLYYSSQKNNMTLKFVGIVEEAKVKATISCSK